MYARISFMGGHLRIIMNLSLDVNAPKIGLHLRGAHLMPGASCRPAARHR
jgi:hypothetical protein